MVRKSLKTRKIQREKINGLKFKRKKKSSQILHLKNLEISRTRFTQNLKMFNFSSPHLKSI